MSLLIHQGIEPGNCLIVCVDGAKSGMLYAVCQAVEIPSKCRCIRPNVTNQDLLVIL